jgi:hypothetical protein
MQAVGVSLLVIDSIGVFFAIDRAVSDNPVATLRCDTAAGAFEGPNIMSHGTHPAAGTLQRVHVAMVASLQRLLLQPVAALLTSRAAVATDNTGQLLPRPYLPLAWQVRCAV